MKAKNNGNVMTKDFERIKSNKKSKVMTRLTTISLLLMSSSFESGDPLLLIPSVSATELKSQSKDFYAV